MTNAFATCPLNHRSWSVGLPSVTTPSGKRQTIPSGGGSVVARRKSQ
jgi:hypothetical protein